jgi:hypothetical protein
LLSYYARTKMTEKPPQPEYRIPRILRHEPLNPHPEEVGLVPVETFLGDEEEENL